MHSYSTEHSYSSVVAARVIRDLLGLLSKIGNSDNLFAPQPLQSHALASARLADVANLEANDWCRT